MRKRTKILSIEGSQQKERDLGFSQPAPQTRKPVPCRKYLTCNSHWFYFSGGSLTWRSGHLTHHTQSHGVSHKKLPTHPSYSVPWGLMWPLYPLPASLPSPALSSVPSLPGHWQTLEVGWASKSKATKATEDILPLFLMCTDGS